MSERVYDVRFLFTGNSARSILAEPLLRKDGRGRFRSFSAGNQPKRAVNPFNIKVLESLDYPTEGLCSKAGKSLLRLMRRAQAANVRRPV